MLSVYVSVYYCATPIMLQAHLHPLQDITSVTDRFW